jgi:hypothetical protein
MKMGREIRKVPPHWNHPTKMYGHELGFQPMFDETHAEALAEYQENRSRFDEKAEGCSFEDYYGEEPDAAYYRPYGDAEATWLQMFETVSEGTPVTPPFATPEELVDHLVEYGESLTGRWNKGPWGRSQAEAFVKAGWAPSLMVVTGPSGGVFDAMSGFPDPSEKA